MSQSLSQQWVHIIFSTKDRFPYFKKEITQEKLYQYMRGICLNLHCHPLIIGGMEEHVHLLVNLDKKISLSGFIEEIKKSTSRWLKSQSHLEFNLSKFYWQKGYGAFSVSQSTLDHVKSYIENQKTHHRKIDFKEELKLFLIKHKVEFNEDYLW
jgi:putative transposase